MKKKKSPTSIQIPPELYQELKVDLTQHRMTFSQFWEQCARDWLTKREMPQQTPAEKQVMDALRKLLHRHRDTLMVTMPPLLEIKREVLEDFLAKH